MGRYINPGNEAFSRIISKEYVDKSGMIHLLNNMIDSEKCLTCVSRPRRFGKSFAAKMLCAYYDRSCDSHTLFDGLEIAKNAQYELYLNKFHVISLDITSFLSNAKVNGIPLSEVPARIASAVLEDVKECYPELERYKDLTDCLLALVRSTDTKIVYVIDEWDALIREAKNDAEAKDRYLNLLREWFKNNNFTPNAVAAAYMTGILPIKKDGSQSAISDFQEYTILEPLGFAPYFGFTEKEVQDACVRHHRSFDSLKKWYDGYSIGECRSIYNPYSVMKALESGKYRSYWKKTSAAETLTAYIDMDQDGLQGDIAKLIAGEQILVDTDSFQNDVDVFGNKDDVLTLLAHLGYLAYEEVSDSYEEGDDGPVAGLVRIPNEEVRTEFGKILRSAKHRALIALVKKSEQLLLDTLAGNADAVAKCIAEVHDSEYAPTYYNNEQCLRYVVKMAYLICVDEYAKLEELPSGHGLADLVFLPKRLSRLPAMVVELKWNKNVQGAIRQIKERNYPNILQRYGGEILLVGVSYDPKSKIHTCEIERVAM